MLNSSRGPSHELISVRFLRRATNQLAVLTPKPLKCGYSEQIVGYGRTKRKPTRDLKGSIPRLSVVAGGDLLDKRCYRKEKTMACIV